MFNSWYTVYPMTPFHNSDIFRKLSKVNLSENFSPNVWLIFVYAINN